jgi:MFS family permease
VNWYNLAAVFSFIALDFSQNVSGLGFITGSFYLGLGIFQVPGGIVAAKNGPKKTAVVGTLIESSAALLSALASEFYQITILRFIVGAGMAFVFAPGVILVVKHFRKQAEGFSVGLFNVAFYLGGALGLFGWAVFAESLGWRMSLATSGGLGILTGILMIILVPRDSLRKDFVVKASELTRVLSNKWLILVGFEMFGITGGSGLVTAFMVYYLEGSLGAAPALAGIVAALALVFSLLASPIFGRAYDLSRNAAKLMFLSGVVMVIGLAIASVRSVPAALFATSIVGFCSGGALTVGFSAARDVEGAEYQALAVSWVNSLQLFAGFFFPLAFSSLAARLGYGQAWVISGLYTFPLIAVILISKLRRFQDRLRA